MRKQFIAVALAGVMLLSGCSSVSEESYNAVVAENEGLKSENSQLKKDVENYKSDLETFSNNCQVLIKEDKEEIDKLKKENAELKAAKDKILSQNVSVDVFNDILAIIDHPKSEIYSSEYQKDENGIAMGQYIYSDMTLSMIVDVPYLDNETLAKILKDSEETYKEALGDTAARGSVVLYRNPSSQNIGICLFKPKEQAKWVWFDDELKAAYEAL